MLALFGCAKQQNLQTPADTAPAKQAVAATPEQNPYNTIEEAVASAIAQPAPVTSNEQALAASEVSAQEPNISVAVEPEKPELIWDRLRQEFSFPACEEGSRAAQWAEWYGARQDYMDRVLRRAEPWLFDIAEQIKTRQLPADLVLLPIVESAFDPFASSRGRAVGTWQFVRGTAGDHGLQINDWYDGRRDVYAATRAALDYLHYLFNKFNHDWRLALAAYNGGQGRVARALRRYRGNSDNPRPDDLRLPRETRSYAPKLHGLSCLIRDPVHYGLNLPDIDDQPRVVAITLDGPLDLIIASRLAELEIAELYALNPGFSRWATPPEGPHRLILPLGKEEQFSKRLNQLPLDERVRWHSVIVRSGDTLSDIAARVGIPVDELMAANALKSTLIRPGQELRVLGPGDATPDEDYNRQFAMLQKLQGRLLPGEVLEHEVRRGESLWTIARRYKVSSKDLARWNGINNPRRIHPGQRLRVARAGQGANTAKPAGTQVPNEHRVRRGESLWTIARQYRLKLRDLLRWNSLDSQSILRPGQKLRLNGGG